MKKKTYIIGEIAQAHDGSIGILHSYIDALSETGVDAIKFQTHIADAESSEYEPFRINFSYEDKSRFDYWKRMTFNKEQWIEIRDHCKNLGLDFISSPFSNEAVDLLEDIGIDMYKVGSGEVNNFLMLEKIAKTNKTIILSSGMSSYKEIEEAVNFLEKFHKKINILQCTTSYPTDPTTIGLNVIPELQKKYPKYPIGLSDHSSKIWPCLSAVSLGAELVEFHAVFDKKMFGPDSKSSLTIDEISKLVSGIRYIDQINNNPIDKDKIDNVKKMKLIFEKSLSLNRDMKAGEVISFEDLESKKPFGYGIPAKEYKNIIEKKLVVNKNKHSFLNYEDVE